VALVERLMQLSDDEPAEAQKAQTVQSADVLRASAEVRTETFDALSDCQVFAE